MGSRYTTHNLLRLGKAAVPAASLIVSAYLMALAIESPHHWWLGWVTLLPLFFAIRILSPLRALSCGALWGGSLFLFSLASVDPQIAPTVGSLALLSAIPAVYAYLGARLTRRFGFSPLTLGFGWIGVELALGPLGLKHGLLAGAQGEIAVLNYMGSFAGYALVAFLVAYVNAWLLSIVTQVHTTTGTSRVFSRSGDGVRPLVPLEVPCFLFQLLIRPSRPRGPPVCTSQ